MNDEVWQALDHARKGEPDFLCQLKQSGRRQMTDNSAPKRPHVDLVALRLAIRSMTRKQEIYRVLKEELTALGYWKQQGRGRPFDGIY